MTAECCARLQSGSLKILVTRGSRKEPGPRQSLALPAKQREMSINLTLDLGITTIFRRCHRPIYVRLTLVYDAW